jgi:serine/threonine protein phosphatase 1
MPSYAISDVHGCYLTLRELCDNSLKLSSQDRLYVLGDHIDNGPSSWQVLDYYDELKSRIGSLILLRGNHEQRMLKAYQGLSGEAETIWLNNGGRETLMSFGVDTVQKVPDYYLHMLDQMEYCYEVDDYLMVHAGFNFAAEDPFIRNDEMLEIRGWYYDEKQSLGKTILHGHTPTPYHEIEHHVRFGSKAICLDNGCCKEGEGLGNLVAIDLSSRTLIRQECLDR